MTNREKLQLFKKILNLDGILQLDFDALHNDVIAVQINFLFQMSIVLGLGI